MGRPAGARGLPGRHLRVGRAPLSRDQRDLLLTGAILHDIGKLEELRWGTSFDYTLQGQLVGHITIGIAMIEKKKSWQRSPAFPRRSACFCRGTWF